MPTATVERIEKYPLTKQEVFKKVEAFIKELKASGLHIRKAILFGSYAYGNPHQYSDIDLALAADEFIGVRFLDNKLIQETVIKPPYIYIETKTYPTDYFEKAEDPFLKYEILKKGIEIPV